MRRVGFCAAVMMILAAGTVLADGHLKFGAPEGDWAIRGGRLYQRDAEAPRAKAWIEVPQNGAMIYEFTFRYEGGAEDGHGGVGLHILSDSSFEGKAWGMGDSWLLWLNYDVSPTAPGIPRGLSAQLYKSTSDSDMGLVQSISLRAIESAAIQYLQSEIPIKLTYLADRGRILVADPRGKTAGWYVDLPSGSNDTGQYAAVRTNGVKMSFTSPDVGL